MTTIKLDPDITPANFRRWVYRRLDALEGIEWRLLEGEEIRCIQGPAVGETTCPIVAASGGTGCAAFAATGTLIGTHPYSERTAARVDALTVPLVDAADNNPDHDPRIRAALLRHCGLVEGDRE